MMNTYLKGRGMLHILRGILEVRTEICFLCPLYSSMQYLFLYMTLDPIYSIVHSKGKEGWGFLYVIICIYIIIIYMCVCMCTSMDATYTGLIPQVSFCRYTFMDHTNNKTVFHFHLILKLLVVYCIEYRLWTVYFNHTY